jgi:hypothetical protein
MVWDWGGTAILQVLLRLQKGGGGFSHRWIYSCLALPNVYWSAELLPYP